MQTSNNNFLHKGCLSPPSPHSGNGRRVVEDFTKQLTGDDLIRFLIADLKLTTGRQLEKVRAEIHQEIETLRAEMHQEIQALRVQVDALDDKVDRRLAETRSTGEAVQTTLSEIPAALRCLEREIGELGIDTLRLRVDQRDLEERLNRPRPA